MQLASILALGIGLGLCSGVAAQSLSPMHKTGPTPGNVKAFRLQVGNPYPGKMTFIIVPMDPKFEHVATNAVVRPSEIKLAPGFGRAVTVQFAIPADSKERTIGVCVMPKDLDGPLLPRVCGTYTGVAVRPGAGR